ncbi:MAG TPA: M20/M25/M40 family metallo-hydrolase [Rubrobacter sp.]|nr:M20/M25/M40 family metallo-hydrolase [Rubrobacter sp.]
MRRIPVVLGLVLALLVAFGVVGVAIAADPTDTTALRNAVSVERIIKHERAFQKIADSNGGTRVTGTQGYDASADYVAGKLKAAGYNVTVQEFTHPFFQVLTPTTFSQTAPTPTLYEEGPEATADFNLAGYSGSGDLVDARVVPTNDIIIPPTPTPSSSSGCEAGDFPTPSTTERQVALIQRGTCTFRAKAENAQAAGYDAAIIFNEGQEGRQELIGGGLGGPGVDIPVLITSFAVGQELYLASPGARVSISAETIAETRTTSNVIADYPGGSTDRTIMVGAHLDSVPEGPGINDNGSGVAGILEIALQMKKLNIKPTNHVRFAFWGAEESSPPHWGSQAYLEELDPAQLEDIALYLNFDMIGSPNYVRFVYDGNGPTVPFGDFPPDGSGEIEQVFLEYFDDQNLGYPESIPFDGRSDYQSFFVEGIPAGGVFSGAEGEKTEAQAAKYGGVPGLAYDPCYHQACDTLKDALQSAEVDQVEAAYGDAVIVGNINTKALDEMSDAAAHATLTFAQRTSAVSGTD